MAERVNRTIEEHVIAMLEESHLPPSFLGQAVAAYIHIWNRCSTTSLTSKTPFELWHRKNVIVSTISHLSSFCLYLILMLCHMHKHLLLFTRTRIQPRVRI